MSTVAYLGDSEPMDFGSAGVQKITEDLNKVMELSPTGVNDVDAIFFVGDASNISQAKEAHQVSDAKNVPLYFAQANHETESDEDMAELYETYNSSTISLNPGPFQTFKTTYSMDIEELHIVNVNDYWNGLSDNRYFKDGSAGGYIPDALYQWVNNDLQKAKHWKIVLSHSPLYPETRHVGESLDKDESNRDKFENLLITQNVPIYIASHTHFASITLHDNIYHVDAGAFGPKVGDSNADKYASIMYTHTHENGQILKLTWVYGDPTLNNPKIQTVDVPPNQGGQCNPITCSMIIE